MSCDNIEMMRMLGQSQTTAKCTLFMILKKHCISVYFT